ncbi:cobyrinate a,c-diamide synthase [Alkaliphilus pronyensis]|nr:cobyrinate a,c-diamide synthase [Alkaliphilus pronyensis]
MKRIMIAGTASGVGKTTISLGIMKALSNRGIKVSPFKVGPDYIDPGFHKYVTGNPSHNLDSWFLHEETLSFLFQRNMKNKDIGVIEGVMGLYDGFGVEKSMGNSAHVSKILKSPVILVIDAGGMSTSSAAMALGYKLYDQDVKIKAIIINNASGKAHYEMVKTVIERDVKISCIGYLPSNSDISLDSRHLGLIPSEEAADLDAKIEKIAQLVEEYIDLDTLLNISGDVEDLPAVKNPIEGIKGLAQGLTIGVAKDKAFSFYYNDNLQLLKELGAKLVEFSPIEDIDIPKDVDALYIGGGFPEVFAKELQDNWLFRQNLKRHLEDGLPAYAECGGLMYLTEELQDLNGEAFKMVGFILSKSIMTKRLQRFGYVNIKLNEIEVKGHEFHRSFVEDNESLSYVYDIYKTRGGEVKNQWRCGIHKKNTLAAYPHVHFYSSIDFVIMLLEWINKGLNKKQSRKENV